VLARLAELLATIDPARAAALTDRALAVAGTIPEGWERSRALTDIAGRLAAADPIDPALIDRALKVAGTMPNESRRSEVSARIHALTEDGMLDELSRWRLLSLGASIDLLNVFLGNSRDKTIAERIGLAILDVAKEFPATP
jgi:hypothetical protein